MKPQKRKIKGPWLCYAIFHSELTNRCYIGQTNNFDRRIRQHNHEIKGGARYTGMVPEGSKGRWIPLYHVCGFKTLRAVLQMEIALKRRRVPLGASFSGRKTRTRGPRGKIRQLEYLLHLGKLNEEPHSPFARNGVKVRVFLTKHEYLRLAEMTAEEFEERRRRQGVRFIFSPAAGG